jgi:hypothetical protein
MYKSLLLKHLTWWKIQILMNNWFPFTLGKLPSVFFIFLNRPFVFITKIAEIVYNKKSGKRLVSSIKGTSTKTCHVLWQTSTSRHPVEVMFFTRRSPKDFAGGRLFYPKSWRLKLDNKKVLYSFKEQFF